MWHILGLQYRVPCRAQISICFFWRPFGSFPILLMRIPIFNVQIWIFWLGLICIRHDVSHTQPCQKNPFWFLARITSTFPRFVDWHDQVCNNNEWVFLFRITRELSLNEIWYVSHSDNSLFQLFYLSLSPIS